MTREHREHREKEERGTSATLTVILDTTTIRVIVMMSRKMVMDDGDG
jgi:hypothetical protein